MATRLDHSLSSSRGFAPLDEGQAGIDRRRRTVLDARSGLLELDENLKALEFLRFGAHIALNRRPQHASNRPSTQGWDLLLSSLRSNVFGDAFAASQERQQYCEMRGLQANDGRAGQGSSHAPGPSAFARVPETKRTLGTMKTHQGARFEILVDGRVVPSNSNARRTLQRKSRGERSPKKMPRL